MCLIISHRNLKTASKDITVYKLLLKKIDGTLHGPYQIKTQYIIGELFVDTEETEIKKQNNVRRVGKGFVHAYKSLDKAKEAASSYYEQIHNLGTWKLVIHKTTIPKGSKYYEGTKNEICSKSVIVQEELFELQI